MSSPTNPASTPPHEGTVSSLGTKVSVISRFQSIRSTLSRKLSSKKRAEPPTFPPESWSLSDSKAGPSEWTYGDPNKWTKEIEQLEPTHTQTTNNTFEDSNVPPPEPSTIAAKIRHLIQSLPLPSTAPPSPSPQSDTQLGNDNKPAQAAVDPKLVQLLSSERVMNGSTSKPSESIWSILERLGPKRAPPDIVEAPISVEETNGVMLCAPLSPTPESEVELADSDIVLEYVDNLESNPQATTTGNKSESQNNGKKLVERREWHPSATKLSLQANWWGYRLYLPPPILETLSDAQLAAAKRGAMIAAALKWLLDKIPMSMIPPQFRPALTVLKRLTPYLGYVGAFVAWSWERVKKKDNGHGVVLTATWLVPIALIPATWDADVHGLPKADETGKINDKEEKKVADKK